MQAKTTSPYRFLEIVGYAQLLQVYNSSTFMFFTIKHGLFCNWNAKIHNNEAIGTCSYTVCFQKELLTESARILMFIKE